METKSPISGSRAQFFNPFCFSKERFPTSFLSILLSFVAFIRLPCSFTMPFSFGSNLSYVHVASKANDQLSALVPNQTLKCSKLSLKLTGFPTSCTCNVAQNSFQHVNYNHSLSRDATFMIAKYCSINAFRNFVQFLSVIYNMCKTTTWIDPAPNFVN